jgi:electron transport complex protein RnfG
MKNMSATFVLKVAGTLTAIALVVAALLGLVNSVTWQPIQDLQREATEKALQAVATDPSATFDQVEITDAVREAANAYRGKLLEMYKVSTGGYACKVSASGSQGMIQMIVGVDAEGKVTGVSVVENAETAGIGSRVMENETIDSIGMGVLDQFKGLSGDGTLKVGKTVTPVSGATVSTKGITAGVNAALAAVKAMG